MSRSLNSPHTRMGMERQRLLLEYLRGLAERGEPLPENDKLREVCGIPKRKFIDGALFRAFRALTRAGLIKVHYQANVHYRSAEIVGTDLRTPWPAPPPPKVKPVKAVKPPREPKKKTPKRALPDRPVVNKYPLLASRGMSDFAIYGHLADAVRACRRAGDIVHRNEQRPAEIMINGRPGDVKARAAWHARVAPKPFFQRDVDVYAP